MKQTISKHDFTEAFRKIRPNSFTYAGLEALFEYLEQYEKDTGEEIELDVISLCCEYSEYQDLKAFQDDYNADEYESIEDIENATTVIRVGENGFIIQQF